jgi:ribosomal-protein-serine acetyltransferase
VTDRHPRSTIPPLADPLAETIEGPRVTIRRLRDDDVAALHALVLDNLDHLMIMPFASHEPMTFADRRALVAGWAEDHALGLGGAMGIWLDGDLVGMTGLHRRSARPEEIEIGYWLDESHEGLGIAAETTLALVEEAFSHPQIEVVTICADISNERSRATAERSGFRWVATRPTPPEMRSAAGSDIEAVYELRRESFDAEWPQRFS